MLFLMASLPWLGSCTGPLSTLDPAGPAASAIAQLWWTMLWGAALLFLLVMLLLGLAFRRPDLGKRMTERSWLLFGGLVMPIVILGILVVYALYAGERLLAHPQQEAQRVHAQASAWQWTFSYPQTGSDGTTQDLHIPAGQPVDVVVTSTDVIHSFWVPRLAGKIDAIPGHENVLRIEADQPGVYQGVNAEFNGRGHAHMHFRVIAHDAGDYTSALWEALQ